MKVDNAWFFALTLGLTACSTDNTSQSDTGDVCGEAEARSVDCQPPGGSFAPFDATCQPLATDYVPGADDMWPACVTDDGEYHLVADTPSSIARVEAYDQIRDMLLTSCPSPDDFTMARTVYAQDEGLESRLVRREDLHYPEIPMEDWEAGVDPDKQCTVEANISKYPDRCAGPAKLTELVNDAFSAGQMGEGDPNVHAAGLDATMAWFFFLSTYKEAFTCTIKAKDCDSSWAYYTGGTNRGGGIGLSAQVRAISPEANEAIWNGFSAVRCWRDLYPIEDYPTLDDLPPEGRELFQNGWEQLDNALWHGFALVVRDHIERQANLCGSEGDANWAWVKIAGPVLDFEARARDGAQASVLSEVWATDAPTADDLERAVAAIDSLFPCPQP